jgi:hypothetical protein
MSSCDYENKRLPPIFWTEEETTILLNSFLRYGPNWYKIAERIPTRTLLQVRQKFYYINSKLNFPTTLYTPLEEIDFENVYKMLQDS